MTRPTTLVLAALVLLLPGAAVRAEATTAKTQPATAEIQQLQGAWEGVLVGQESAGKITITFSGNSLHFQGLRADQWYDATFTLQEGTRPRQLRATITACAVVKDIGTVIGAIFKIENRTLSLAGLEDDGSSDDAAVFDGNTMFHYRFRKVGPLAKKAGAPLPP